MRHILLYGASILAPRRRTTDTRTPRPATEAAASCEATRGIEVELEAGTSSSIASRLGVRSPVPEVTIKGGQSQRPLSREPMACRSVSQVAS
jgi:hypothetical protein